MSRRSKLLWLDIPCLPGGFKMITPYCAQVIILSALPAPNDSASQKAPGINRHRRA
jgi:hypothetical protein